MTDNAERYPYGAIKDGVEEWIETAPEGIEFYYGDVAADLGVQAPSVSATLLTMFKSGSYPLALGTRRGRYRKLSAEQFRAQAQAARAVAAQAPPGAAPAEISSGDKMEVVGRYKTGNLLLRAADGSLWQAEEL